MKIIKDTLECTHVWVCSWILIRKNWLCSNIKYEPDIVSNAYKHNSALVSGIMCIAHTHRTHAYNIYRDFD